YIEAMNRGPLAAEKGMGLKVRLVDAKLHEDSVHRGPAQVIPAARSSIYGAMVLAGRILLEPIQKVFINVPQDFMGSAIGEIQSRRGVSRNSRPGLGSANPETPRGQWPSGRNHDDGSAVLSFQQVAGDRGLQYHGDSGGRRLSVRVRHRHGDRSSDERPHGPHEPKGSMGPHRGPRYVPRRRALAGLEAP